MPSSLKLTASSELMSNYKQVAILDQCRKFMAAQSQQGHALFFSVGTDARFYLIQEKAGSKTGWEKVELSAGLPGQVKTFCVAQNHQDGHIDIAVVLTDSSGADSLYLSMDNSYTDLRWSAQIAWNHILDDRQQPQNPKLEIVAAYLTESNTQAEYAIVDTKDANGFIARYWINVKGAQKWNPHPLADNLAAAGGLSSYMGRKAGEMVDGIYTMGNVNQLLQLIYTPLYNPFDLSIAPNPINFDLSGSQLTPTNAAFAVSKALSGVTTATDLFIAGGGTLYYLPSVTQTELAKPIAIFSNDLFTGVRQLYATTSVLKVVIWGLNEADQIFYTACNLAEVTQPGSWSIPLPLMQGVAQASTYVDQSNEGITLFAAVGEDVLLKGIQDPTTTQWKFDQIELPTLNTSTKATKALSYTTTVHVTDQNNNPAADVDVTLIADARCNVFINNLYYVLDTDPITVKTDANGTITMIEWVAGLHGTTFNCHTGDPAQSIAVDPMTKPLTTIGALNTEQALGKAQITNRDGSTRPLLPASLSSDDTQALLSSINDLHTAYQSITTDHKSSVAMAARPGGAMLKDNVIDYITVAAGDLLQFLKHASDYVIDLVHDAAQAVWHFVVTLGDKIYGFVLDTVGKIASALEAVWNKIVKGFDDLIEYLKFLFEWQDMVRTKDVMKQFITIFFHRMGEDLQTARAALDSDIVGAEALIREWASIPNASRPALGASDHSLDASLANTNPPDGAQSAPAKMLQSHFAANVQQSTTSLPASTNAANPSWTGLSDLSEFVTAEQATINDLVAQVKNLLATTAGSANPNLSVILQRIAGDLALGAMDLFKMAADKVLDLLTLLIDDIIKGLDAPIYIPLVSDILEDLFDITMPSILDVICIIGAVPTTIIYKAIHDKAPYPAGSDSLAEQIKNANSYAELAALFNTSADPITLANDAKALIFETGHLLAGIATLIRGVLVVLDEETDGGAKTALQTPITITSVVANLTQVLGDLFVMPLPLQNGIIKSYASVVSKISILQTVAFMVAPKAIAKIKGISDDDGLKSLNQQISFVSDGITAILSLIGLVPPAYHIYEIIANETASLSEVTLGIMESTQDITAKLSKVVGFAALADDEEISKQILIIIQGTLIEMTGWLLLAEVGIEAVR